MAPCRTLRLRRTLAGYALGAVTTTFFLVAAMHLSTDEPYYIGLADNAQCREKARAQELGSVGKLLAEFLTKTEGFLRERGRTAIFWGEYPLKPDDIPALPNHLVNGEVYGAVRELRKVMSTRAATRNLILIPPKRVPGRPGRPLIQCGFSIPNATL